MKKTFLISGLAAGLVLVPLTSQADRVTGALKLLQKQKAKEAKALLDKELTKNPKCAGAHYVYALYFLNKDSAGTTLDSAYTRILKAQQDFAGIEGSILKKWQKWGITDAAVQNKKAYIDSLAFSYAATAHTVESYESFITRFPTASQSSEAIARRNELAFAEASRINTYDSYKVFLEKYPDSKQAREAEKLYELLLFEFHTKDEDITAYELFVELYPTSPYRAQAEKKIYELFTAAHTLTVYHDFVRKYPENKFTNYAWHWLYSLYKQDNPVNNFLKDYPDCPEKGYFGQLIKSQALTYFPIYQEETQRYGFMDAEGNAVIPTRYDSVANDYFCDGVKDNFLLVFENKQLGAINKTGRQIIPFGVESVELIEDDLLLVKQKGKTGVIHEGGFPVIAPQYDEVELLDENFILVKVGNMAGLTALNGRQLTPVAYDDIESLPDGVLSFRRGSKLAMITREKILTSKDTALDFRYDRIEPVKKGYFKVCSDNVQAIVNTKLQTVLSSSQPIKSISNGWVLPKDSLYQVYDNDGHLLTDSLFNEVTGNEAFFAGRKDGKWALWRNSIQPNIRFDYDTVMLLGPEGFAVMKNNLMYAYFRPDNFVKLGNFVSVSLLRAPKSEQYWVLVEDKNGKKGLYTPAGKQVIAVKYDKITVWGSDLFCVQMNGRYGLVNQFGKIMLQPNFSALEYQSNGMVATLRSGKFGLIQTPQDVNIPNLYEKLLKSYDGTINLFIAMKNGKYGLISSSNQTVADFSFDEIRYWQYGVALVKQDDKWHLYSIADKKFIFKPIEDFQYIRKDDEEILIKIYADKKYGILSNAKGVIVDFEYDDLRNVGTEQIPLYLAENYVDDADVYMVHYMDRNGKKVYRQLFDQKRYERIICE